MPLGLDPYGDTLNRCDVDVVEKEPRRGSRNEHNLNEEFQIITQLTLIARCMAESRR